MSALATQFGFGVLSAESAKRWAASATGNWTETLTSVDRPPGAKLATGQGDGESPKVLVLLTIAQPHSCVGPMRRLASARRHSTLRGTREPKVVG